VPEPIENSNAELRARWRLRDFSKCEKINHSVASLFALFFLLLVCIRIPSTHRITHSNISNRNENENENPSSGSSASEREGRKEMAKVNIFMGMGTLEMYLLSHKDYVRLNLSAHFGSHFRSNVTQYIPQLDAEGSIRKKRYGEVREKHIQFWI
jgi:hypothetical protein